MKDFVDILKPGRGKKLMVIFPHPDDESFATGGLLLLAKKFGWDTTVVTLTKGGAGKIYVNGKGRSAVEIRGEELTKAARLLQVTHLIVGDFSDARLLKDEKEWIDWLTDILKTNKPDMVVTYDHSGMSANPDHVCVSVQLLKIVKNLSHKPELFWMCMPKDVAKSICDKRILDLVSTPEYFLDCKKVILTKWLALAQHRSQFSRRSLFKLLALLWKYHYEWYYKVDLTKTYKHKIVKFDL